MDGGMQPAQRAPPRRRRPPDVYDAIPGIAAAVVIVALVVVFVLGPLSSDSARGFTGFNVFADPGVTWRASYTVLSQDRRWIDHHGDMEWKGDEKVAVECEPDYRMDVTVTALNSSEASVRVELWVRGVKMQTGNGHIVDLDAPC